MPTRQELLLEYSRRKKAGTWDGPELPPDMIQEAQALQQQSQQQPQQQPQQIQQPQQQNQGVSGRVGGAVQGLIGGLSQGLAGKPVSSGGGSDSGGGIDEWIFKETFKQQLKERNQQQKDAITAKKDQLGLEKWGMEQSIKADKEFQSTKASAEKIRTKEDVASTKRYESGDKPRILPTGQTVYEKEEKAPALGNLIRLKESAQFTEDPYDEEFYQSQINEQTGYTPPQGRDNVTQQVLQNIKSDEDIDELRANRVEYEKAGVDVNYILQNYGR